MLEIVISTKNKGKMLEYHRMLNNDNIKLQSLLEFPKINIVEDGNTFSENAIKKAKTVVNQLKKPALADDSGLEVRALGGRPGIFTARYAGLNATDEENNKKLLLELKNIPWEERQARFVCCIALALPKGQIIIEHGFLEGYITFEPRGEEGFGYDPIFYVPKLSRTLAELKKDEKNKISHRAKALSKIKKHLTYV